MGRGKQYYCGRCDRAFINQQALQQHINDSYNHHRCSSCQLDCPTWQDLVRHVVEKHSAHYCKPCNEFWWTKDGYQKHRQEKNVCKICDEHFMTLNNLQMHSITHQPANVECFGCYNMFKSYGYMINHIQMGACSSGFTTVDLNMISLCFNPHWPYYSNTGDREEYFNGVQHDYSTDDLCPFACPSDDCGRAFRTLGALIQHVESPCCNASMDHYVMNSLMARLRRRLLRKIQENRCQNECDEYSSEDYSSDDDY